MRTVLTSPEDRVLQVLAASGSLSLQDMVARVPELSWSELFSAVDRLSRGGTIILLRRGFDYDLRLRSRWTGSLA